MHSGGLRTFIGESVAGAFVARAHAAQRGGPFRSPRWAGWSGSLRRMLSQAVDMALLNGAPGRRTGEVWWIPFA